jgi:hypothetical protein
MALLPDPGASGSRLRQAYGVQAVPTAYMRLFLGGHVLGGTGEWCCPPIVLVVVLVLEPCRAFYCGAGLPARGSSRRSLLAKVEAAGPPVVAVAGVGRWGRVNVGRTLAPWGQVNGGARVVGAAETGVARPLQLTAGWRSLR